MSLPYCTSSFLVASTQQNSTGQCFEFSLAQADNRSQNIQQENMSEQKEAPKDQKF